MPGPVSDSYDPEFGTGSNAADVADAIQSVIDRATELLGSELKNIVEVAQSEPGRAIVANLTEREWRIIRFGLTLELNCAGGIEMSDKSSDEMPPDTASIPMSCSAAGCVEIRSLLVEAARLLEEHHDSRLCTFSGPCPLCTKKGTELFPKNIFGRISSALER